MFFYLLCFGTYDNPPVLLISLSIMWLAMTSILLPNLIFALVINSWVLVILCYLGHS